MIAYYLLLASLLSGELADQVPPPQSGARFDVASVKSVESRAGGLSISPTTVTMDYPAIRILMWAYGVDSFQIIGPEWLGTSYYHITAKTDAPATEGQLRTMLQNLLADRLGLVAHWETKEMVLDTIRVPASGLRGATPSSATTAQIKIDDHLRVFTGYRLEDLAILMSASALPTVDLSGNSGRFDFSLDVEKYVDTSANMSRGMAFILALRDALHDKMGLTFKQERVPVRVLAIDKLEKTPTPD